MRYETQLFSSDSPAFILSHAKSGVLEISQDAMEISWQMDKRQLIIRAKRQKEQLFSGQLLAGAGQLPLGKVFIEPNETLFSWNINIIDGHDEDGEPVLQHFMTMLIQPLLGQDIAGVVHIGQAYYLQPEQCQTLLDNYLSEHQSMWQLYYYGCIKGLAITAEDILAIGLFANVSSNLPASLLLLWDSRFLLAEELAGIPGECATDSPELLQCLFNILHEHTNLNVGGVTALLARKRPDVVPLLTSATQSWYYSLDGEDDIRRIMFDIARDITKNSCVLEGLSYRGEKIPKALLWTLILQAVSAAFMR